ncbi:MAG: hypothetical protein JXR10_13940 [Cyclobacteriaceae bacterium]
MSRTAVMLGLLVGFLSLTISGSYTFVSQATAEVNTQQPSDEQSKDETVISSFDAITGSTIQFSFGQESFLIEILPELDDQEETKSVSQSSILALDKVLKILFQRIISPNAP